jgi:valyl-tRNA synthetase
MKPANGTIYRVRYERVDRPGVFVEVKTTRPETIPATWPSRCIPRIRATRRWIGKKVSRALGPSAEIPIIADAAVDKEFGTGALKITPAHDKVDFDIGLRHKLPVHRRAQCPTARSTSSPVRSSPGLDRFAGPQEGGRVAQGARAPWWTRKPTPTTSASPSAPTCRSSRA